MEGGGNIRNTDTQPSSKSYEMYDGRPKNATVVSGGISDNMSKKIDLGGSSGDQEDQSGALFGRLRVHQSGMSDGASILLGLDNSKKRCGTVDDRRLSVVCIRFKSRT